MPTASINIRGKLMMFDTPKVMGIVNVTPDSFYAGSRTDTAEAVQKVVRRMVQQGVDIIDVGGCSTRPESVFPTEQEEMSRLDVALAVIRKRWPGVPVSVDTFRSGVARRCVQDWGVDIINDVSGGTADRGMFETVADLKVAYVLMHTRGTLETMQQQCNYSDVTAEVIVDLASKIAALHAAGVSDIILDPGFGFAKTVKQNYMLLNELEEMRLMHCPLLVGVSRKSMVRKVLDTTPEKALNGTTVLNTVALLNGADILRVHDVLEAKQTIALVSKLKQEMFSH